MVRMYMDVHNNLKCTKQINAFDLLELNDAHNVL